MRMLRWEKTFITRPLSAFILISFLAALIYSNTFTASFHFDDGHNIVNNPWIKDLSNLKDFSGTRYIGFLSFALNYHFGGLNVFGYHLVNLLIHIMNGFLVYHLVLLLFKAVQGPQPPAQAQGPAPTASGIALATALLFIAHPIQTQAVTYIVQRFASLAALFYLLAVVCYLKWRSVSSEDRSRYFWYAGALLSTVLAMKTKENSFTLPLMLVLIEAVFFRPLTRRRWVVLIPFLLTLLIIPLSRVGAVGEAEAGLAQETTEISRTDYLFTQFRVITTYLRLLILPVHQNLKYDYPIYHSLLEPPVLLSFLFLSSLFVLAFYLLFNSKFQSALGGQNSQLIAFGILWIFLALSTESSFIPIRDVIFEHRLYLPSVGFFLAVTIAALYFSSYIPHFTSRLLFSILIFAPILLILSAAAYKRNLIWKDEKSLWEDGVSKAPGNAGAHNNLGVAYENMGRWDEAIQEYQIALRLKQDFAEPHDNLGNVYAARGQMKEAIQEFQMALKLRPDLAEAHNNLGSVLALQGRLEEAIQEYRIALRLKPGLAEIHYNLGDLYRRKGKINEAISAFEKALQIKPDFLPARQALDSLSK